jgi:glyoxylase-like metal-dependent hydrolase (beta-lactamase superfamily II)
MAVALEDELGDIIGKARTGRSRSPEELACAGGVTVEDVHRIESCRWTPDDAVIVKMASALDLHGPSLVAIARGRWSPRPVPADPVVDVVCLDVFMGMYPVKCYLIRCKATGATAVVDTGGNPEAIIAKAQQLGCKPALILLTHCHPDHADGLHTLDREFGCPTLTDRNEPRPSGSRDLRLIGDGDVIELGRLRIRGLATPGHTPGGMAFHVGDAVIGGDAVFAGSMGRANISFPTLFQSITKKILTLSDATAIHPGHGPATTVGEEKAHNPFFAGIFSDPAQ